MTKLTIMALCLFSFFSCKGFKDLNADEFDKMFSDTPDAQLVDVRTAEEFASGHILGAVNIDWHADNFMDMAVALLDKSRPVMVYCRSGKRSAAASAKLAKAGFDVHNLTGGILGWQEAGKPVTKFATETFRTKSGIPVHIALIKHGSLEIRYKGLSIQIDPVKEYGTPTDYEHDFPKADLILVTHEHPDHLDLNAIIALSKEDTRLYLNAKSQGMIGRGIVVENGGRIIIPTSIRLESSVLPEDIVISAVPAYNTTPGREMFHPKGNGNGYVLEMDGLRIYVAGDTEDIPEMAELKDIDVAFLPVNQPYTMTVEQCVAAARVIQPKVLIPYHFSKTDISGIPAQLPGIDVRLRQMQ